MNKKKKVLSLFLTLIIIVLNIVGCQPVNNNLDLNDVMIVHYIVVGQGDSILIQVNDKNLLIDAGSGSSEDDVVNYLNKNNIKKLDYVLATHPHEDHIGGMDEVIENFEVGEFYSPKVAANTKTFKNMINELNKKNLKIKIVAEGMSDEFNLGEGAEVEVYTPMKGLYGELNNYSPIMKVSYGETSFLFTGDAEREAELEAISSVENLKSDVLKVGHHGSSLSTTEKFLEKVDPEVGVISVGEGNKYNHPTDETLSRLNDKSIKTYRTDIDGTVVIKSDGENIISK
ncbi:ComEC/Rec2 family competence protein [Clostridium sulfidigenes]|uniref:ComEC/Rec2 family competence protein n=1 Tax=Clostridium sulfidigenes TaxID=318464 RepID=UPI003F8B4B2D